MIDVRGVTKVYRRGAREIRVLQEVSCQIPGGSFAFVVGPSGSGKSTLLQLIGALDVPTSGEIEVDEWKVSTMSEGERNEYRRRHVGFVFQSFNLLSNLTAIENVLIPHVPAGEDRELARKGEEFLKRVGLGDRLEHRPSELSGGEQQRVAIARALLKEPRLVLADEPTGELDSRSGGEVFQCLRELCEEKKTTVVVVTHDQRYIRETDVVFKMLDGQITGPVRGADVRV